VSYNPYASPQEQAPLGGPALPHGPPQPWEIGEVLTAAWELMKTHWVALFFGYLIAFFASTLPQQIPAILVVARVVPQNSTEYWVVYAICALIGWVIGEFFAAGLTYAVLRAMRTGQASVGDFFAAGPRFLPFLAMSFLRALGSVLLLLALIVPGVIFSIGVVLAPYYVVEQKLGPIAALKASWDATKGHKGNLFLLNLLSALLVFAGMLACCFGFFVAVPLVMMAHAIVYARLSGTAPPPPAWGGQPG
jgi:hypothetical protein